MSTEMTTGPAADPAAPPAPSSAKPQPSVKIAGSAKSGHELILSSEGALRDLFATEDDGLANGLLAHCFKVLKGSEAGDAGETSDERGFMLSVVRDLAPRDAVERMLAVQMAATHVATIRAGRWLTTCDNLPQCEAHYTGFNKLSRTFAAQVEALRKHRGGGQQKVTVEHVHVHPGGQAIVGDVHHRGEGGDHGR